MLELLGSRLKTPGGWTLVDMPWTNVAAVGEQVSDATTLAPRTIMSVAVDHLGGAGFSEWQNVSEPLLLEATIEARLVDRQRVSTTAGEAGRRLAHFLAPSGHATVTDQWFVALDDIGWTLTLTASVLRYPLLVETFDAARLTWKLPGMRGSSLW